ncbi:hypothetical protein SADUNF_Sadunf08G0126100 [Salix dunnii]|uniref:Bifunctional inhibitor/plant lipid transfer protein/seed storage helical domain-containing protein n=1 Tax=Salix dunnii TaxID=1413687 RepID=A0A835MU61_9ROSI|nr:hypothetical protein SADUNF_Sadunf08G0126100 [Salix dunnii]
MVKGCKRALMLMVELEPGDSRNYAPGMLQARDREMDKALLIGMREGRLPVTTRHKQSIPLLVRLLSDPQQRAAGEEPLAVYSCNLSSPRVVDSQVPIKAISPSHTIKLLKLNNYQDNFTFHEHFRHLTGDSMAHTAMSMGLAMVLVTMLCARTMAQSDCTSVLISMSPCLNYITGNSSTPSSQCCTQLASVVRSSPQCLCQVLNGGGTSLGINVNQTQAIALPGACKVQTPPISRCNGASPAASPAGASEAPSSPSGTGSKTVPSTQIDGTSGASSIEFSIPLLLLLFSASYTAFTEIF